MRLHSRNTEYHVLINSPRGNMDISFGSFPSFDLAEMAIHRLKETKGIERARIQPFWRHK